MKKKSTYLRLLQRMLVFLVVCILLPSCKMQLKDNYFVVESEDKPEVDKYGFDLKAQVKAFFIGEHVVNVVMSNGLIISHRIIEKEVEHDHVFFQLEDVESTILYMYVSLFSDDDYFITYKHESYVSSFSSIEVEIPTNPNNVNYNEIKDYIGNVEIRGNVKSVTHKKYEEEEEFGEYVLNILSDRVYTFNKEGVLATSNIDEYCSYSEKLDYSLSMKRKFNSKNYIINEAVKKILSYMIESDKTDYKYDNEDRLLSKNILSRSYFKDDGTRFTSNKLIEYNYNIGSIPYEINSYIDDKLESKEKISKLSDKRIILTRYSSSGDESYKNTYDANYNLIEGVINEECIRVANYGDITIISGHQRYYPENIIKRIYNSSCDIISEYSCVYGEKNMPYYTLTQREYSYIYDDKGNWVKRKCVEKETMKNKATDTRSIFSTETTIEEREIEYYDSIE